MDPELWLLSPNTAVTAGKNIDQEIFTSGENGLQLSPCPRCCWAGLGARSQTNIPLLLPARGPGAGNSVPCPARDGPASLHVLGRNHWHVGAEHPPPPSRTEILWGFPETSPGNKPRHKPSLAPRQKGKERTQFPEGAAARAGDTEVKSDNRFKK